MSKRPDELPLAVWMVISVLCHVLFIGGAELFGPEAGPIDDPGSMQAQYRLPETGAGGTPPRGIAEDDPAGDLPPSALSISFETADPKYQPYFKRLRGKVGDHWPRPRLAPGEPEQGSLLVEFVLGRGGDLRAVAVARSSGVMGLDFAAMEAVKSAAPFEPFPPEITEKELEIRALFVYE